MNNRTNVICLGNIAFDLIAAGNRDKKYMTFRARPGGSVFNTSVHMARLGLSVSLLAKTGGDFLGDNLLKILREEKIEARYVMQDKDLKTALALARIDRKGNSSYLFYRSGGQRTAFKKGQVPSTLFKKADVFHTASAYTYSDFTFENTLELMEHAKKEGVFISYDPNWRRSRITGSEKARKRINRLISFVDLLKLSESDALGITGAKTLSGALSRLGRDIVVTLGHKGAFFWDGKKKTYSPVFKVPVVDTIGAGDAFTAGLIYRYCLLGKEAFREEKKDTLAFASAASALVCKGRGATEGLRSAYQVKRFLSAHGCNS